MKLIYCVAVASCFLISSCSTLQSGGDGITDTEIATYTESINRFDLEVDTNGITYTIDISTPEGLLKCNLQVFTQQFSEKLQLTDFRNHDATYFC